MLSFKNKLLGAGLGLGAAAVLSASQIVGAHYDYDARLGGYALPLPSPPFKRIAFHPPFSVYAMAARVDVWRAPLVLGLLATTLGAGTALASGGFILRDAIRGHLRQPTFGASAWGTRTDAVKAGLIAGEGPARGHAASPFKRIIGEAFGTVLSVTDDRFIGVFMATRKGKSRLMALSGLTWKSSAFFYIAGALNDIWKWTSGYRATFSDVILLDLGNPNGWRYNPLSEIRKGTSFEWDDCKIIANELPMQSAEKARIPYWVTRPTKIIASIIRYVIHMAPPDKRTLSEVIDLASLPVPALAKILISSPHSNVQKMGQSLKDMDPAKAQELMNSVLDYLGPWESEAVREVTSSSDFSMSDLMAGHVTDPAKPVSLYIRVPDNMTEQWSTVVKVIFAQAQHALLHHEDFTPDGREKEHEVGFFLDELAGIVSKKTQNQIAKMAKYGGFCYCATQSPKSLQAEIGPHQTISDNLSVQIYAASSDGVTLRTIEDLLAETTEVRETRTKSADFLNPLPKGRAVVRGEHVRKLLNTGEIRSLPADEMLVIVDSAKPFRVKKIMNIETREPWRSIIEDHPPAPVSPSALLEGIETPGAFI